MNDRRWTAADFDYTLPEELIAQLPVAERGGSRLLVVERDSDESKAQGPRPKAQPPTPQTTDGDASFPFGLGPWALGPLDIKFAAIADLIPPTDLLVLNNTRVLHARLLGRRPLGGPAEVLLIHPSLDDSWIAMGKPGRALAPGQRIILGDGVEIETIELLDDTMRRIRFVGATAAEAMARFGKLPLPPYIDREPTADDDARYQTVYADREGSVAAPTAGLHFTGELLDALRAKGVAIATLDLEVGPGTFRPMEDGEVTAHPMHSEHYEIPDAVAIAIAACRARGGKVWAVGTTVVRALESAARDDGTVAGAAADTRLMIAPGFRFRVVDRLITNFHLPKSTLLMLVAAFAGYERTMAAYRHAVEQRYRFYSYGDAMCVL